MPLRTAIVGGGTVSGRHLNGVSACPHTELVGICDIDEDRAREQAAEYDITAYTDTEEMIDQAALDWGHICTPVGTHLEIALAFIEAGIPVLIEKPVTETVEEYEELAAAAEEAGVTVSVVHNHDFDPVVRDLTSAVEEGAVGDVLGVEVIYSGQTYPDDVRRGEWAFELPGGEFEEGIPHPLYLLLRTGGYPANVDDVQVITHLRGEYDRPFSYDGAKLQYASENEVLCSTTLLPGNVQEKAIHVHGDDGVLVGDLVSQTLVRLGRDYEASPIARARHNVKRAADRLWTNVQHVRDMVERRRNDDWETAIEGDSLYYQIDAEARALLGRGEQPHTLTEAGWTIRLMDAIREQAADRSEAQPNASVSQ